jgi:ribosomal protein S18 acetylase RimI-like enzyme
VTPSNTPPPHWRILRDAIRESITTSPASFLTTADEVAGEDPAYWEPRLRSAAWAVAELRDKVVGIAAAKAPGEVDGYALQENACFIESVWIAPEVRQHGIGERLVTYLIEQQRQVGVQKFYLWVFDHNTSAKRLYQRMEFKATGNPSILPHRLEVQFVREFGSDVIDAEELARNAARRDQDRRELEITYRMLSS